MKEKSSDQVQEDNEKNFILAHSAVSPHFPITTYKQNRKQKFYVSKKEVICSK
jgi:hypothetical protein